MLTVVHDADSSNEDAGSSRSLLDEIVRDGARQMLAAALRAEVAAYIEAHAGELDENGHRLVVRNGYHREREVLTAAGAVSVTAPRVNDKRVDPDTGERQRFSSAILPAWVRKSPQMTEVLPLLYLHGLSTSDFGPALEQFLGSGAACRPRRSPDSPRSGRTRPRPSRPVICRAPTTSTCGSTASISRCAWSRRSSVCW
nr:transposase [Mycolicibacterium sp. TY66]